MEDWAGPDRPRSLGQGRTKQGLKLYILQASSLEHGVFEGILDDDDRGPDRFLTVSWVPRGIAEERPEGIRSPGVVRELQVDVPKATLVTDGRQVLPR